MIHRPHPVPLAPHDFQILLSVLNRPRHGYSIIKDIEHRTEGQMVLGTSTVYAAMKRMELDGILEKVAAPPGEASGGPRRSYYGLTDHGRRLARAEGQRIRRLHEMVEGTTLMDGTS
jgi:DNA-binding PadR family transcriptional regulator